MGEPEVAQDIEARAGRARTPAKRAKQAETEKFQNAKAARMGQMKAVGRMLAGCPMNADELAEQWEIAADDADTIMVKILKQKMGTQEQELMDSVALVDYDGERIAANFGPGIYYLRPGGRKYAKNAAKLPISETLARACGYGRIPLTAGDAVAERTIRSAADGPTDPADLFAAIERIIDRREAEKARQTGIQGPGMADPMTAMKNQFEQIQTMMAFMASLEERAIKTVEMRMGKSEFNPTVEDTNSSLLEKLLPKALDIFSQMMTNRNPVIQPASVTRSTAPALEEKVNPTQDGVVMPALTQDEQKSIGGAVAMLRPFAPQLLTMTALSDSQIVAELEGYVPVGLVESLKALGLVVTAHGPTALSVIHPGLATDRWAAILPKLIKACEV